jgi:hypothetical protein
MTKGVLSCNSDFNSYICCPAGMKPSPLQRMSVRHNDLHMYSIVPRILLPPYDARSSVSCSTCTILKTAVKNVQPATCKARGRYFPSAPIAQGLVLAPKPYFRSARDRLIVTFMICGFFIIIIRICRDLLFWDNLGTV